IGSGASANYNYLTLANGGSYIGGGNITVGTGGATGNVLNVNAGSTLAAPGLSISATALDWSNVVNVTGGSLYVTNAAGTAQLNVGPVGDGTLTFNGGSIYVNQLLVTNNVIGATNSFFNWTTGTLTTSNTANQVASKIVLYSNQTFNVNGNWNMLGGSNFTVAAWTNNTGAGNVTIGNGAANAVVNVATNAVWSFATNGSSANINLTIGNGAAATSNALIVNGGFVTNVGNFGFGASSANNNLIITNGGQFASVVGGNNWMYGTSNQILVAGTSSVLRTSAQLDMGGKAGSIVVSNGAAWYSLGTAWTFESGLGSGGDAVVVTGPGSVWTNGGYWYLGGVGASNSVTIANGGMVVNAGGSTVGNVATSSNNFVLVTGTGSTWSNLGALTINYSGIGNSLTVSNGGLVTVSGLTLGYSGGANGGQILVTGSGSMITNTGGFDVNTGSGNSMTIANSGRVYNASVILGGAWATNNIVTVTDTGSVWSSSGSVIVGGKSSYNGGYTNNMYESVIVSNGAYMFSGSAYVGYGTNDNFNKITVTGPGSVWSNAGWLAIGGNSDGGGNSIGNSVTITNGGAYYGGGNITVGGFLGASNNSLNIIGNNSAITFSNNGLITIGQSGASLNSLFVTNATMFGGLAIGVGASNNTATVLDNVTWDFLGYSLKFGAGTGNVLNLTQNGTTMLTNVGGIILGGANQTFTLTNASGTLERNIILGTGGSISVGDTAGWGGNTLLISNQVFKTTGASYVGSGSSNNTLTILADTVWNNGSAGLTVGTGAATGNIVTISSGVVSNLGALTIGATAGSIGNSFLLNNGGMVSNAGAVVLGGGAGATGNSLVVSNATWLGGTTLTVGNNATASNNTVLITGASTVFSNSGLLSVGGSGAKSNTVTIANGAQVYFNNLTFSGGGYGNTVLLTDTGTVFVALSSDATGYLNYGGSYNSFIISNGAKYYGITANDYLQGNGFNNQLIVTGPGSVMTNSGGMTFNWTAAGGTNKVIISNYGLVVDTSFTMQAAPGMQLLVTTGGVLTNSGGLQVGSSGNAGGSAIISAGGAIINKTGATYIGYGGGGGFASNDTMLVTGAGSVLSNAAGNVTVGTYGSWNYLTIADSGFVYSVGANIGANSNNWYNVATLTDTGSVWRNNGALAVGQNSGPGSAGGNQVIVSNGAALYSTSATIGSGLSLSNAVVVTGGGSTWTNTGTLVIGSGAGASLNTLTVTNGGLYVGGGAITVGTGAGANSNSLNVFGTDSANTFSNNGLITVGSTGGNNNTMTVTNVAVFSTGLWIGNGSRNNTVTIDTNTWNFGGGALQIGSATGASVASNNVFNYVDSSQLTNLGGVSLYDTGDMLYLTNRNLTTGGGLNLGAPGLGNNTLILSNQNYTGNAVSVIGLGSSNNALTILQDTVWNAGGQNITVGSGAATGNVLTVNGGLITNAGYLSFSGNYNTLLVTNGGVLNSIQNPSISGTGNRLLITGIGSVMSNSGNASSLTFNGGANYNNITVSAGGSLIAMNGIYYGIGNNATGNVITVTDTGSVLRVGATGIYFGPWSAGGNDAFNALIISNGGSVYNASGLQMGWSGSGNNNNQLIVTGPGSTMTNAGGSNGSLILGQAGTGNLLLINNGGLVADTGNAFIGFGSTGMNTGIVTGAGSVWTNAADLYVGQYSSANILTIANSGSVFAVNGRIGAPGNGSGGYNLAGLSNNVVTVTDTGSVWKLSSLLSVGGGGSNVYGNQLVVSNGALVVSGTGSIGSASNALNNIVIVTGPGSTWTNAGVLTIGNTFAGFNSLTVTNGGTYVGGGNITVGTGVSSTNNSLNIIGNDTAITFSNNGLITVGSTGGSNNTMLVTNANVWSKGLTIGNSASFNTVTVNDGSTVWNMMNSNIVIGVGASSNNVLTFNGGIISNVGTLFATNSNNRLVFNGGTLNLNNGLVYSNVGNFVVGNGTSAAYFQLAGGTAFLNNKLIVSSNATITGVGTILTGGSGLIITNGATVAPGNGVGILTADTVQWYGGSTFQLEVTNFNGVAGTDWDRLNVTGALTIITNGSPIAISLSSLSNSFDAINFNAANDYNLAFVGFGSQTGYNPTQFAVDTNAFNLGGAAAAGTWGTTLFGTNLYLTYAGLSITPNFVWSNSVSAGWSTASAWTSTPAFPATNGNDTLVLQFNGSGTASYIATNNLTTTGTAGSFTNNALVLNSYSTGTNTLAGATLTFAGAAPMLYQQGGGMFIISNAVKLTTDTVFRGPGLGTVVLASNVTGAGGLTKQGNWNLTLLASNSFAGPVLMNSVGGTLTLANIYAIGTNSITVSNGTVVANTANTSYIVGNGWSNQQVLVTGSSSVWSNLGVFAIGTGAAISNSVTIQNGAQLIAAGVNLGTNAAFNSFTITNATLTSSGAVNLGFNGASNTATVLAGATVNLLGNFLRVGAAIGTGNTLTVNQGIITNGGNVVVGGFAGTSGGANNSLIITNGGQLWSGGA
ncbi:MAG: hypothetical protein WCH84_02945, partial [Verrucomicrobiota bacterium]